MKYLLDANIFIEAKNRYYGFDFCPAFWDWLLTNQSMVCSIDKVQDEIMTGEDELSEWVSQSGKDLFFDFDQLSVNHLVSINQWIIQQQYDQRAMIIFQESADYYLLAYAKAHSLIVVTHEQPSDSKRRIKIPNVAIGTDVKFMNPFQMLKIEQANFVLG